MRIDGLFTRDECCTNIPDCSACPADTECRLITSGCSCPELQCVPKVQSESGGSSSGGVSKGAVAGAVVGVLIFLGISIALFTWYRRRSRKATSIEDPKPDVPAAAVDVLNRPDPTEKPPPTPTERSTVRVYSTSSNTTIDLDPESQISHGDTQTSRASSVRSNPFSDNHSIQTAGTGGTNVIPIALVSPDSGSLRSQEESTRSASPVRPVRTPEMDLNLDHVNVSKDSLRPTNPKYAQSQISGISGVSSRNSYMSSASYSSDFLNEAPMIVTANKGPVRQVMGVRKAEMVNAGSLTPTTPDGLRVQMARPAVTSPLAATSFGPSDVASVSDKASVEGADPFSDKHSSTRTTLSPSSAGAMTTTFTDSGSPHDSIQSTWTPDGPTLPWTKGKGGAVDSRPSSISTQAGSVIDIASATRVNVGLSHLSPPSTAGVPRSPYRTTMGRLVTPPTNDQGTFEEQQQMALAHAQAQARAQGLDTKSRRTSRSSVVTSASVGDSILESFPFVPPSPISDRPVRSPPVSPLAQHTFVTPPSPGVPPSPSSPQTPRRITEEDKSLPPPPDRRTLGLSNGSQFSTASSGLGSFPFQIDSGATDNSGAPSSFNNSYNNGRQRASLDTLAITSDLSSYPLGFDRDSNVPPLPRRA
ncbi:hypothetical protein AAF712_002003 [Marasmius tenuissimus]|uniref:Membrane anchor Opy2 N-terminal domain-containing protein n=1 Tax=Marasmius tenuissimus TaxID=585030 RepID=A0ABR3AE02_9AGAR|nr:hypothetical protein PM082_005431 [Marasmius tenuissimus]